MSGWSLHNGQAMALPAENIDTDQLIPARFMSTPRAVGYGGFLLFDQRHDDAGKAHPDHPLNRLRPTVLVVGRNFGSGSSREAAVYALVDFGVRVVLAPSFGDIFSGNAINNGLLPARLAADDHARLLEAVGAGLAAISIDLTTLQVRCGTLHLPFTLDPVWQQKLINGWDDIDLTRAHGDEIAAFVKVRADRHPWMLSGVGV